MQADLNAQPLSLILPIAAENRTYQRILRKEWSTFVSGGHLGHNLSNEVQQADRSAVDFIYKEGW